MTSMRFKVLLLCGVFLVVASGTAAAKVGAFRLTVDGPGMRSAGVIREGRWVNRASSVLLFGNIRARTASPLTTGPAYVLSFRFGVADGDGSRTETIHQTLYPFVSGGPVVFTAERQSVDTTYGPVRFVHGWFRVPPWILRELEEAGLPAVAPEPEIDAGLSVSRGPDAASSGWPWLLGVGALAAATGATLLRQRSRREA